MKSSIEETFHLPPILCITQLVGGANNRVYKLEFQDHEPLIYKHYFQHHLDPRRRLQAEFSFLTHAWSLGIRNIPQPLQASDQAALYSYLPGRPVSEITDSLIDQAMAFFLAINAHKGAPLSPASEACFSSQEYVWIIEERIQRLRPSPELSEFLERDLLPLWNDLKTKLFFTVEDRCISPSDFGFHNALLNGGTLYFLDFEYAGWDDPCKTLCDFFCQPRISVPEKYFSRVCATITSNSESCLERLQFIMPLIQIRWCCILLNPFTKIGRDRRLFSTGEEQKERQLRLAKDQFNRIQWPI